MKQLKMIVLLAMVVALVPVAADAKKSKSSSENVAGFEFQKRIGKFQRQETVDFEKDKPGLGWALPYSAPGIKATVYVYDNGMKSIPEGINAKAVKKEFEEVKKGVIKSYAGAQTIVKGEDINVSGVPILHAVFSYVEIKPGQKTILFSHVYLTSLKDKFIKLRISSSATDDPQASKQMTFDFVERLFQTLAK